MSNLASYPPLIHNIQNYCLGDNSVTHEIAKKKIENYSVSRWSKKSDIYLVALFKDNFERHTRHHTKERGFYLHNDANIFSLYCFV